MAERWTDQQKQAYSSFGHDILVSAGAGSGKTAVLSERVYRHVAERHIDVDRLLVLTFTNKAANEMKVRIRNKIRKDESGLFESEEEKARQINKIDSSSIMTFDAYALSLIRKYHYLFDLDRNIGIIDSNVLKIASERFIDEIMEKRYAEKDSAFLSLIKKHCVKNDDVIRKAVRDLNDRLEMIYDRKEYIQNYEERFYSEEALDRSVKEYTEVLRNTVDQIRAKAEKLSWLVENVSDYFIGLDDLYRCETYDDLFRTLPLCDKTGKNLPRGSGQEASDLKKEIGSALEELKKKAVSREEILSEIASTKQDTLLLLELCEELEEKLAGFKRECGFYSFIDIFKMAIELVDRYPDVKKQISEGFAEILIDEYQDTNDLQEEFISRIAHDNVYMVGDIKQSIYRFRNANPDLFKDRYVRYLSGNDGELIELPHNFRSRKEVLEDINVIFDRIMDRKIGGADYALSHHLKAGRDDPDIPRQDQHLELLTYEYDKKTPPFNAVNGREFEAFVIAKDISEKVGHFEIKGSEGLRKAEYRDFCIIVDRGTNFDLYKQILTWFHIPCVIERDERMDDSDLITVIRSMFRFLTCMKEGDQSFPFAYAAVSLMRSFVLEMTDSEIYDIVRKKGYDQTELYRKMEGILEGIDSKTISDILDDLIREFDLYNRIRRIGSVHENMVKIDYLYQLAHTLSSMGYDFREFDEYLENVFDGQDESREIRYSIDTGSENAVRIINIHKSKGLQYQICYFPALDVGFNRSDIQQRISFTRDLGMILPAYIEGRGLKETVRKDIFRYRYDTEDTGEKIRLLYVALTRTQEKMIMVSPLNDSTEDGTIVPDYARLKYDSFAGMLESVYQDLTPYIQILDPNAYSVTPDYRLAQKKKLVIRDTDETIEVPYLERISPETIRTGGFSKDSGLISQKTIENMELGTRLHYYLETLDFKDPDLDSVDEKYRSRIEDFLKSDLMKDAKKGRPYKEYEFIYTEGNEKRHGFIDLLMEYEDHFDIIDYKFRNIDDEHYDEQLNGYRRYIESISDKKVFCYLYSIDTGRYRKVERQDS